MVVTGFNVCFLVFLRCCTKDLMSPNFMGAIEERCGKDDEKRREIIRGSWSRALKSATPLP